MNKKEVQVRWKWKIFSFFAAKESKLTLQLENIFPPLLKLTKTAYTFTPFKRKQLVIGKTYTFRRLDQFTLMSFRLFDNIFHIGKFVDARSKI